MSEGGNGVEVLGMSNGVLTVEHRHPYGLIHQGFKEGFVGLKAFGPVSHSQQFQALGMEFLVTVA